MTNLDLAFNTVTDAYIHIAKQFNEYWYGTLGEFEAYNQTLQILAGASRKLEAELRAN